MKAFTAWSIVSVGLFALVGFVVCIKDILWPLWFAILPFFVSIKGAKDHE